MMELLVLAAVFVLLIAGVIGSVTPQLPGAPFSIAGVLVYWWGSGFAEPGTVVLALLVFAGIVTWAVDWLGGVVGARVGGASMKTAIAAGLVGLILFFVTGLGPIGLVLGVAGTVFALEFYRQQDARASAKTAAVTTAAMLGSAVVQALLTGSILLAMVAVWAF